MTAPRALIVGPAWVGDMVMANALFATLASRKGGIVLDVLAPAWTRPLLQRMPEVTEALALPFGHGQFRARQRYRYGRGLRDRGYTQAIVLPNSWKSALIPWAARIPTRTGYLGEARYGLLNDRRRLHREHLPRMVERFVALASPDGQFDAQRDSLPRPRLLSNASGAAQACERFSIRRSGPLVALCPGAEFGASKRWPVAHYAELAARLSSAGVAVWLFGSENDRPVTERIAAAVDAPLVDLAGRTELGEAIDLLSLADAVVCNDSGLMHIAAALGRPLVAVYGSTDPGFTPPLSAQARVVRTGIDCSPCFKRDCPLGHHRCMRELPVNQVWAELETML